MATPKPEDDSACIERIKRYIRTNGGTLMAMPNVTSVGIGHKQRAGQSKKEIALQFTVTRKLTLQDLRKESIAAIPSAMEFEGEQIVTDVIERQYAATYVRVQLQAKSARKTRQDPICGGISVANVAVTAGTLGAIVKDSASGAPLILSNWHVLHGGTGRVGDDIVQPGPFDDNNIARNKVGQLLRSHLGLAGDCAVSTIEGRKVALDLLELGVTIDSIGKPALGDVIVKSGRTTGVTYGQVSRIEGLFKLNYDGLGERTIGGFEIEPTPDYPAPGNEISKGGDSGSAWLGVDLKSGKIGTTMLGLHFAGSVNASGASEFGIACYAHSVFQKLAIEPYVGVVSGKAAARKKVKPRASKNK